MLLVVSALVPATVVRPLIDTLDNELERYQDDGQLRFAVMEFDEDAFSVAEWKTVELFVDLATPLEGLAGSHVYSRDAVADLVLYIWFSALQQVGQEGTWTTTVDILQIGNATLTRGVDRAIHRIKLTAKSEPCRCLAHVRIFAESEVRPRYEFGAYRPQSTVKSRDFTATYFYIPVGVVLN